MLDRSKLKLKQNDEALILDSKRFRTIEPFNMEDFLRARDEISKVSGSTVTEQEFSKAVGTGTRVDEITRAILLVLADQYETQPFTFDELIGIFLGLSSRIVESAILAKQSEDEQSTGDALEVVLALDKMTKIVHRHLGSLIPVLTVLRAVEALGKGNPDI